MQISRPRLKVYKDDEDHAVQLLKEIFTTYHISSTVLLQERGIQAEQFNKGCTKVPLLSAGSVVYIKDDTIKPGTPKGVSFRYIGPYCVLKKMHKMYFFCSP